MHWVWCDLTWPWCLAWFPGGSRILHCVALYCIACVNLSLYCTHRLGLMIMALLSQDTP